MSRNKSPRDSRDRWLVVEGDDDQWVTIELLARHGAFWGDNEREASVDLPYVKIAGGIAELQKIVAVQAKSRRRLGIILDADLEAGKAWSNLREKLRCIVDPPEWLSQMLTRIPKSLPAEGLVVEQDGRALGVWIMPDNGNRGALEDFLSELVPPGDIHWDHARQSVADAMRRGVRFPVQYRSKAEIHTWLAWQEDPGLPFGRALKMRLFLHDSDRAQVFVKWFRQLFPVGE